MNPLKLQLITFASVTVAGASLVATASANEVPVTLDKIPAPAAAALTKQAAGAKIQGISQEAEGKKTVYEATLKSRAGVREVTVDQKGNLVSEEKVVTLSSVPEPVRQTIATKSAGGKLLKLELVQEGGKTTYEALIQTKAKRTEIVVAPSGKIVEQEDKTHDPDRD